MNSRKIKQLYDRYLIPCYTRNGIAAVKGRGSWLWDAQGKRYLDLFPGWGVNALGHCHPGVQKAVQNQMKQLVHVPNNFYHQPQAKLAQALIKRTFPGKIFFTNSGAEAVEGAIKLVRRAGYSASPKKRRYEIIAMQGAFHGRTLGAVAATGQAKYGRPFKPLPAGFRHVSFNSMPGVRKAVRRQTVAVMVEPVQGEGGIHVAQKKFLKELRSFCSKKKFLLIFDEISTGMGRTGTLFAYQQYGVKPDILLLAKPLAGGMPMGALVVRSSMANVLEKGSHATTFGGNPVVTAAGLATLEAIQKEGLLGNAKRQGERFRKGFQKLQKQFPVIREIRGLGLMLGIELSRPGVKLVEIAARHGILINCTQGKVIRIYPALNITATQVDLGLSRFKEALEEYCG